MPCATPGWLICWRFLVCIWGLAAGVLFAAVRALLAALPSVALRWPILEVGGGGALAGAALLLSQPETLLSPWFQMSFCRHRSGGILQCAADAVGGAVVLSLALAAHGPAIWCS